MKRIKLTHGSARVEESVNNDTINALHRLSELAYKAERCAHCKKIITETDLKFGKKSDPKLCATCFTSNS
jgi:hypothetical protein